MTIGGIIGTLGVVGSRQPTVMLSLSKHGAPFGYSTLRQAQGDRYCV